MMFSRLVKWAAAAALVGLPGPVLADAPVTPAPKVAPSDCVNHVIVGPNPGYKQITFYDRDDQVIETRAGAVRIAVLGCDATWLFVKSPNGSKAKVRRIEADFGGTCEPSMVSDATAANHSTTGSGIC